MSGAKRATWTRVATFVTVAAVALLVTHAHAEEPPPATWSWTTQKAKINHIDTTKAPEIKIYASYLDRNLKPVDHEAFVRKFTMLKKPKKGNAKSLFSFLKGELEIQAPEEGEEVDEDLPPPVLTLAAEEEAGGAIMVVAPGTSAEAYKSGTLGEAQKTAIELVFKAGANAKMNILWVGDQVQTFVAGDNRATLSRLKEAGEKCERWRMRVLRGDVPKSEKEGEPPPPDKEQLVCGLLDAATAATVPKVIADTNYSGFWPHMFGLRGKVCSTPKFPRRTADFEVAAEEFPSEPSALDVALENVIRDGAPGQPRIIVIIGDGKDGYILGQEDCVGKAQADCDSRAKAERPSRRQMRADGLNRAARNKRVKDWRLGRRKCINDEVIKSEKYAQERFRDRLPTWLGLAKAGNVRIHTLANPLARPHEAQRLEVLSLKTGGTYRSASSSNELIELATELADEISNQYVFTFTDTAAVPNSNHGYMLEIEYKTSRTSGKTKTRPHRVHIPAQAEGFSIWMTKTQAAAESKLGKAGLIAIVVVVGLLLALILLKLLKKIFGKGAKAAAAKGKGAGKAAKGAGKAAKKGQKLVGADGASLIRKIKK